MLSKNGFKTWHRTPTVGSPENKVRTEPLKKAFRLGQNSHLLAGTLSMASIDLAS
jgi:hypothetical protein